MGHIGVKSSKKHENNIGCEISEHTTEIGRSLIALFLFLSLFFYPLLLDQLKRSDSKILTLFSINFVV